jgi:hypothetical protein
MKLIFSQVFFVLFLFPSILPAQNFISAGGRIGYTVYNSVWDLSDPDIIKFYPGKPKFYNSFVGLYGEFFGRKSFSTCAEISYHNTSYTFQYDMKNSTGDIIGTNKINSTVQYISILVQEKIKYGKKKGPNIYLKAGPRVEFQIKKNIDKDFQNVFNNAKTVIFGYTLTGGTAWNFPAFQIAAECFWHGDIIKTYSSVYGKILNNAFGISLSAGWLKSKK